MKSSKTKRSTTTNRAATAVVGTRQPGSPSYLWPAAIAAAVALCVVYTIYGPAMYGPFLFDDDYMPYALPAFSNLPWTTWMKGNRPLLMLSYWLNFEGGKHGPYTYRFFAIFLHFLSSGFIYLAIRKLLELAGTKNWMRDAAAIFAGGLFLLHPLQTESVTYVASGEPLSVCFFLAAFVVFVYGMPALSIPRTAGVLALFGAAALSKEHTAVLPALLLLTDYYWNPGFSFAGIRRNWKLYVSIAVVAAIAGAFIWIVVLRGATTAGFHVQGITWYQYFFTQCRVIWKYILLFVFPFGQNLDPDVPISHSVLDHGAIVGLVLLLGVGVAAWMYRRRFLLASYGWFVFLILLAPTSSFLAIKDPYAERRLYLPFIGLVLMTVEFVRRWKAGRGTVVATLCGVLVFEGALTYQRSEVWSNAITLWQDTAEKSPKKVRPSFQLAFAQYASGRCGDAVKEFTRTASLAPPDFTLLLDWGLAYDCMGNREQALAKLQQAAAMEPGAHVYSQIAKVYAEQDKFTEALAMLSRAEQMDPGWATTYLYRGHIFLKQGNPAAAVLEYRRAVVIDPNNQEAQHALARVAGH